MAGWGKEREKERKSENEREKEKERDAGKEKTHKEKGNGNTDKVDSANTYGVATISRLLKIRGLFCRLSSRLFYRALLQKRPIILRSLIIEATP